MFKCRQEAAEGAPGYKEERLRGRIEATFLLEDLKQRYADATVLRYEGCDYQLPLLQGNARYRCARPIGGPWLACSAAASAAMLRCLGCRIPRLELLETFT